MDKQKQIEEVRQDLEDINGTDGIHILGYIPLAKNLIEKCYRKIPENAVVLISGDKVDMFDSEASGFMTSPIGDLPLNIDGMRKAVDEIARLLIVQAELQDLNEKHYNEAKDLRRELERVRAHAKINDEHLHIRIKEQARKDGEKEIFEILKKEFSTRNVCEDAYEFIKVLETVRV